MEHSSARPHLAISPLFIPGPLKEEDEQVSFCVCVFLQDQSEELLLWLLNLVLAVLLFIPLTPA